MTPGVYEYVRVVKQQIGPQTAVLECGSRNINGTVRDLFTDAQSYTGIDMVEGPDVDHVMNMHSLVPAFCKNWFDCVLCLETLEHDDAFWISMEEMKSVLKPGGHLILTVPNLLHPLHEYPHDYWRFTQDAVRDILFQGLEDINVIEDGLSIRGYAQKPKG